MTAVPHRLINTIMHCDCTIGLQSIPDNAIKMTLTSCPWDKAKRFGGHHFRFQPIAEQLWRITADGSVVVWEVADAIFEDAETGSSARQRIFCEDLGFRVWDTIIVTTNISRIPFKRRYGRQHRFAFVFAKG